MKHTAVACRACTYALSETGTVPGLLCWVVASFLEFLQAILWAAVVGDGVGVLVDAAGVPGSAEPEHATGTPDKFWSPVGQ